MIGELQFFLRLQIKQATDGTFVHQAKYTKDILKKFKMDELKPLSTSMGTTTALDVNEDGEAVDQKEYRSMIDSLLYLMAMRPDIQFPMCLLKVKFCQPSQEITFGVGMSFLSYPLVLTRLI
jgi:hypothetical protein